MALGERIPVIFDAKSNGFNKVRADIAATDGALNKAKVSVKGFGDMLRQNAAPAAIAGALTLNGPRTRFSTSATGAGQ